MPEATHANQRKLQSLGLDFLLVLLGALLIGLPAIYSGFPLIYQDSGGYLAAAFEGLIPLGRPASYGWFIQLASPGEWLWGTIVVQCLLLSYLVRRCLRVVFSRQVNPFFFLGTLTILVLFSGLGWYASQLMPDIFSAGLILLVFLLLFDDAAGLLRRILWLILAYGFAFVHYSHVSMTIAMLLVLGLWLGWKVRKKQLPARYLWRLLWPATATLLTILSFFIVNVQTGHGWRMTRASHVFLMGRMVACGLLGDYLDETCPEKEWKLCPYKDDLPISAVAFIWNNNSPFKQTGYWKNSEKEYNALLGDLLSRPKYMLRFAKEGVEAGLQQLLHVRVGEGVAPYKANSSPWKFFARHMPKALAAYQASRQAKGIDFRWINIAQFVLLGISAMILFWGVGWFRSRFSPAFFQFLLVVLCGYIVNAFVTAAIGNTYDRLQARVAWLLILAAMMALRAFFQVPKHSTNSID